MVWKNRTAADASRAAEFCSAEDLSGATRAWDLPVRISLGLGLRFHLGVVEAEGQVRDDPGSFGLVALRRTVERAIQLSIWIAVER